MFYTFRQNNSGGDFHIIPSQGISVNVIVEADSAAEANRRAEVIGLYFGGEGDCSCCGDRWYEFWDDERGDEVPSRYGKPLIEVGPDTLAINWAGDQPDAYVHIKDGRFFGFILTDNGQYVYDGDPSDLDALNMPMLG